jgi:hypothetical protein
MLHCTLLGLTAVNEHERPLSRHEKASKSCKRERFERGAYILVGMTTFNASEKNLRRNSGTALICPVKDSSVAN